MFGGRIILRCGHKASSPAAGAAAVQQPTFIGAIPGYMRSERNFHKTVSEDQRLQKQRQRDIEMAQTLAPGRRPMMPERERLRADPKREPRQGGFSRGGYSQGGGRGGFDRGGRGGYSRGGGRGGGY